jgi:hypothetical protein
MNTSSTANDVADTGRIRVGGSFRLPTSRG